jgi:hypothetical protein
MDAGHRIWLSHQRRTFCLTNRACAANVLVNWIQIDGSDHQLRIDRPAPRSRLLITHHTLMQLRFVKSESTFSPLRRLICIWRPTVDRSRSYSDTANGVPRRRINCQTGHATTQFACLNALK